MARRRTAPPLAWGPTLLVCALGCAHYVQDEGPSALGTGQGFSDDLGGSTTMAGTGASGGASVPTAGTNATGGGGNMGFGGVTGGGPFSNAGTFSLGGTFASAGTSAAAGIGGSAAGGVTSGGTGGGGKGGTGGTSGADHGGSGGAGTVGCAGHAIPPKATWTATASIEAGPCPGMPNPDYCGPASRAIDGLLTPVNMTRYTTGTGRTGTEWLQIDFGTKVTVSQVVLTTAAGTDYTHGFEVRMSADAANIAASASIVSGMGQEDVTTIAFPAPATGQFLRINQTTSGASWWSIQELDASCQ